MGYEEEKQPKPGPASESARLEPHVIAQIEEAMAGMEGTGEVCLVVRNGRVQFIEVVTGLPLAPDEPEARDA